jgi:hypothetical protein
MKVKTGRFVVGLLLLTGIIGILALMLRQHIPQKYFPSLFPYMLAFFFLVNSLFFFVFLQFHKKNGSIFIRQFMMLFGVKFITYLIAAIIVLLLNRKEALGIAISGMSLYLLYTCYEVYWMTSLVKRKEQNT